MNIAPRRWCVVLLLAAVGVAAHAESAPRRSVSASTWLIEGDLVTARLVLPAAEAASLVGKAMPLLSTENVAKYVLGHVAVASGGVPCEATDQGYDIGRIDALSLGSSVYAFEIIFRCPRTGTLTLEDTVLFAEEPRHVDFARIERGGAHSTQLFTAARPALSVAEGGALPTAGARDYARLGSGHVWRSLEWLCAMLGFYMLARTGRRLTGVLAALALGYAAALVLTAGGLLPDAAMLGAGMGFVVACIAALLATQSWRRAQPVNPPRVLTRGAGALILAILVLNLVQALMHRPAAAWLLGGLAIMGAALVRAAAAPAAAAPAAVLPILTLPALAGLTDGLSLPADYERLQQAGELTWRNLVAFDAGSLLCETLLLVAFAALALAWNGRAIRIRLRPEAFAPLAGDVVAAAFAGLGSFWWLSRLY